MKSGTAVLLASSWSRNLAALLGVAVVFGIGALSVADEPTGLGNRIVDYCKQHRGKCVGNGSCAIFAAAALQSAGAKTRGPNDPSRSDRGNGGGSDFNWGVLVFVLEREGAGAGFKVKGEIKEVRPGDIIQFTNTTLAGGLDEYSTYTMKARHHTAIVSEVQENGTVLKIYHQGANGRKKVSATSLRLTDLQRGRFDIYHPIAKTRDESRQNSPASDRAETPSSRPE